jgi:hypothetical protein
MTADGPIDTITNEMQPLIEYFESLKTKYKEDKIRILKSDILLFYNLEFIFILINLNNILKEQVLF